MLTILTLLTCIVWMLADFRSFIGVVVLTVGFFLAAIALLVRFAFWLIVLFAAFLIILHLSGCATVDEYEAQDHYNIMLDKWNSCREAYNDARIPWITYDPVKKYESPKLSTIVSDLSANDCTRRM